MNIFVITVTIGWLVITSDSKSYKYVRLIAALLSVIGISGVIAEHLDYKSDFLNKFIAIDSSYSHWLIISLVGGVLLTELFKNRSSFSHTKAW